VIVIDASVFVKLFKKEEGSDIARALIDHILEQRDTFLAPSILLYEALSAALHVEQPFDKIGDLFDQLRDFGLGIEEPTKDELVLSEKIARTEAPGGGYPTLFDSIYHAMAIRRGGTLVTADRRHLAKAEHLGSVMLLSDWRQPTPPRA
jgi:predicted nucleic acid-binding protein